ncbi:MAG TPA: LytR C-terminal domain-containing protein [Candidatus Limnocylindria bacterium]|nr:LytR C-terminal domain-containing protein [Candidatus Limnocylindria bacterium]
MSTLTPSGGRKRRGGQALTVILVGLLVLAAGGYLGWRLMNRNDTTATSTPTNSGCPTPGASPTGSAASTTKPLPKPSSITVDVLNATDRQGLAKTTASQLEARGFDIGAIANDPAGKKIAGTAQVRYGPKGKRNATVVAAQVPGSALVNDRRTTKTVSLALGEAYTGLATPEEAAAALTPSPSPTC